MSVTTPWPAGSASTRPSAAVALAGGAVEARQWQYQSMYSTIAGHKLQERPASTPAAPSSSAHPTAEPYQWHGSCPRSGLRLSPTTSDVCTACYNAVERDNPASCSPRNASHYPRGRKTWPARSAPVRRGARRRPRASYRGRFSRAAEAARRSKLCCCDFSADHSEKELLLDLF